jgi:hypothetical protein
MGSIEMLIKAIDRSYMDQPAGHSSSFSPLDNSRIRQKYTLTDPSSRGALMIFVAN